MKHRKFKVIASPIQLERIGIYQTDISGGVFELDFVHEEIDWVWLVCYSKEINLPLDYMFPPEYVEEVK